MQRNERLARRANIQYRLRENGVSQRTTCVRDRAVVEKDVSALIVRKNEAIALFRMIKLDDAQAYR